MPRPAHSSAPTRLTAGAFLRQLLGLTQLQWGVTIGTIGARVADAESGRRALPQEARHCDLLLDMIALPMRLAPPRAEPAPTIPPTPALPLAPPAALARSAVEQRLDEATHHAYMLRRDLARRRQQVAALAQVQAFRRAFLLLLADPPATAAQYRSTLSAAAAANVDARLTRLRDRLADDVRIDDLPGGSLDPTALALDQLRLHLFEIEAATLAAWLAPAPAQ